MLIGTYEVLGTVAKTATATVWKGRDTSLDRDVAMKHVATAHVDAASRLRSEAAILAQVDHPNIVTVFDLVDDDKDLWLIEQWIEGAPLDKVIAQTDRLKAVDALALTRGALQGLGYAHRKRVVHGDVSPGNILIDSAGTPMLVDFGLAGPSGLPGIGGTPGYLAPEAAQGRPVTARSDVYGAAATLARLLLGQPVYRAASAPAVIRQQLTKPPKLAGIEPPVADVITKAMSTDPVARPADANELLALLDEAADKAYGSGWLTKSSLGAIGGVATTLAMGVQIGGTVAAGVTAPGAATASFGGIAKLFASVPKALLIGTGGAVAVGATFAGYEFATADDQPRTETVATQQQPANPVPHPSAALAGKFAIIATAVSTDNMYNTAPGHQIRWTLQATPICPAPGVPCSTSITTQGKGNAAARYTAGGWTSTYTYNSNCVDDAGIPNGGTNNDTATITLSMSASGTTGHMSIVGVGDCPSNAEYDIVGTRTEN